MNRSRSLAYGRARPQLALVTRGRPPSVLAFLLVLAFALSFFACGSNGQTSTSSNQTGNGDGEAPAATATALAPTLTPATTSQSANSFSGQQAYQHVLSLAEEIGSRPTGTAAEEAAARYIAQQFRSYGFEVTEQPFPFQDQEATAEIVSPQRVVLAAAALSLSKEGEASGQLVAAGKGSPQDLSAQVMRGNIALIARGDLTFSDKVRNAAEAGAIAAIIYNNQPGPFRGTLVRTEAIPAISISREEGQELLAMLEQGPVTAQLSVSVVRQESRNVIARPPQGDCVVIVGGHYDSVSQGSGANDNASGTAVVLELARAIGSRSAGLGVCFAAFGAEEIGLLGSEYMVQELTARERASLRAMINLDMVGVGSEWVVTGSSDLVDLALQEAQGLSIDVRPFQLSVQLGSDHQSFIKAGISAVFIHRRDDPNYHTAQDRAVFVDPQALADAGRLALRLIESLAARS